MVAYGSLLFFILLAVLFDRIEAYRGWGAPTCTSACHITRTDCLDALGKFFGCSGTYTAPQNLTDSAPQTVGTCTVVLYTPTKDCQVTQDYLISGASDQLKNMSGKRGGLNRLLEKCIDNEQCGDVMIFPQPGMVNPDPGRVCTWTIKVSQAP